MNKKPLVIILLLLLSHQQCKSGLTDNYVEKLISFFLIDLTGTIMHEHGHALMNGLFHGTSKIYMGINKLADNYNHSKDGRVNFKSFNPYGGLTKHTTSGKNMTDSKRAMRSANGPIFGILYNLFLWKMFDVFKARLSPAMYISLRTYVMVKAFQELTYGFVPLYEIGDTAQLYHYTKVLSKEKYKTAAGKGMEILKWYAAISSIITGMYKLNRKWAQRYKDIATLESMEKFKLENPEIIFLYKITSLYAMRAAFFHLIVDTFIEGFKAVQRDLKKTNHMGPSPIDWVPRSLISPLII